MVFANTPRYSEAIDDVPLCQVTGALWHTGEEPEAIVPYDRQWHLAHACGGQTSDLRHTEPESTLWKPFLLLGYDLCQCPVTIDILSYQRLVIDAVNIIIIASYM